MTEETGETRGKRGISLTHVVLTLYAVGLTHFLATVVFHHSVDNLIGALVELAVRTAVITALAVGVFWVRERRRRRRAQG
ncbi:hypothetical protein [Streptomyces sp. NPDC047042]|uniref:hypothetical protein n=1 Tax=Streptomyces sp. NPDC047042 TaxID=3154807 RepID=UPI0033DBFCF5